MAHLALTADPEACAQVKSDLAVGAAGSPAIV
jgi:hypothetical protein